MELTAREVLILDSNTFIAEIGLASRNGSALKHYLYRWGMQLVVPEVVAEECERHLTRRAQGKRRRIEGELQWMGRFCGRVSGWWGPNDETIAERAQSLSRAEHLGAVVIPETHEIRQRAESRNQAELPPGHKSSQLADCRIWEQCLDLLARYHIVLVSGDGDFRGYREPDNLHPALRAEAEKVAEDRRLTFHRSVESLLSELGSGIQPIPNSAVFAFVYASIALVVEELESNSGCHPKGVGEVKQALLTTDQAEVIEVRLEITDIWESADETKTMDFRLSGSCHYRLAEEDLCDLTPSSVTLLTRQPSGPVRAVKGSYTSLSAYAYAGAPPIRPEPTELVPATKPLIPARSEPND
ncbi:MAG: PIN domain-containing protein [Bryobacterales bacterium]|nr:PIN domain-containing protein [Bryobacterales bacterium]